MRDLGEARSRDTGLNSESRRTSSKFTLWCLTNLFGYKIVLKKQIPRQEILGRMRYRYVWHLRRR